MISVGDHVKTSIGAYKNRSGLTIVAEQIQIDIERDHPEIVGRCCRKDGTIGSKVYVVTADKIVSQGE